MDVEGITWHAVTLEPDQFAAMKTLCTEALGLTPMIDDDGWTLFAMPNGTSGRRHRRRRRRASGRGL
jgi:hypothetical protein